MAHRVEFSQFDVIVMQIGSPGVPPQVLISFTVEPIRNVAHSVRFRIERSQSPYMDESPSYTTSPYVSDDREIEIITENPGHIFYQSGQTVYMWRRWYYRIFATVESTGEEFRSEIKTWESDPKVFEIEIIARHDWLLRYETGTPCFALVERTAGADHCQGCYNESLGRTEISQCSVCYGTGRERPFYTPILSFVDFNPPAKVTASQQMELQAGQANVWWSAYPQLKPRDILVEVLSGKRWRVVKVNPIGDVRTSIQHFATLEEIKPRDIEYQIEIPADVQRTAVNDLEAMKDERRF
jgi:hypothetical protein